jgi:hypothetical protein
VLATTRSRPSTGAPGSGSPNVVNVLRLESSVAEMRSHRTREQKKWQDERSARRRLPARRGAAGAERRPSVAAGAGRWPGSVVVERRGRRRAVGARPRVGVARVALVESRRPGVARSLRVDVARRPSVVVGRVTRARWAEGRSVVCAGASTSSRTAVVGRGTTRRTVRVAAVTSGSTRRTVAGLVAPIVVATAPTGAGAIGETGSATTWDLSSRWARSSSAASSSTRC